MVKTAAIVVIGDEILSGQTEDQNSLYLSRELKGLGVRVKHIAVIPDDIDEIASSLRQLSDKHDYVFTTGGIGPTHDDVTIEGVARGFGVEVTKDPGLERAILEKFQDSSAEAAIKMAGIPRGAELIETGGLRLPIIVFRNIFIFPGIPEYLKIKFEAIKERFRERPFHMRRLHINGHESSIAHILKEAEEEFLGVKIGSYPVIGKDTARIKVTMESKERELVEAALEYIMGRLDPSMVIGVE
jgi:molybdenum cofactor synthesis domain-containing protein